MNELTRLLKLDRTATTRREMYDRLMKIDPCKEVSGYNPNLLPPKKLGLSRSGGKIYWNMGDHIPPLKLLTDNGEHVRDDFFDILVVHYRDGMNIRELIVWLELNKITFPMNLEQQTLFNLTWGIW